MFRKDYVFGKVLDEQLIHTWQQKRKLNMRQFTLLHMMGTHGPYYKRYPANFAEHLESTYDRSVRYVDSVLEKLFADVIKNDSADVVIFISDHGEDGRKGHDSSKATMDMISIPLIVYISEKYAKRHPELAEKVKAAKDKTFTNDLTFELLLDIMGIESSFTAPSLHVLSEEYGITAENARTLHGRRKIDLSEVQKK